jgi:hypothetical protein
MARIDRSRVEQMVVSRFKSAMEAAAPECILSWMGMPETEPGTAHRTARVVTVRVQPERGSSGVAGASSGAPAVADLLVEVIVQAGAAAVDDGTGDGQSAGGGEGYATATADAQRVANALSRQSLQHAGSTHTINLFAADIEEADVPGSGGTQRAMLVRIEGMVERTSGEDVAF